MLKEKLVLPKIEENLTLNPRAPFSPRQLKFIYEATAKYNLAHGSVRSGKTVCTLFAFLKAAFECPGETIAIFGFSMGSVYTNVISLLFNSEELKVFRPFCSWSSKGILTFATKKIICIGAGDEGAMGKIQGMTLDLALCDEMTLYPEVVIDMIQTRLSRPWSKMFAAMNPKQPSHKCKQWIDRADKDGTYYALHFSITDNPYLQESYIEDLKASLSGLFYKRNYLGIWCLAEGAIYDFFDKKIHVQPIPKAAEYWICAIDYGTRAPFACLLLGVNTGRFDQSGRRWWVEKEYYWNPEVTNRQKTNAEFAKDVQDFVEPYALRGIYVDPSAAAFKLDLQRLGIHCIDANNDVQYGLQMVASEMYKGNLTICPECVNLIKEIEGYVWDEKKVEMGKDCPLKGSGILDHACVTGDTLVLTVDGEIPIKKLAEGSGRGFLYNSKMYTNLIEEDAYTNASMTRSNQEVFKITLINGYSLKSTGDHVFYSRDAINYPKSEMLHPIKLSQLTLDNSIAVWSLDDIDIIRKKDSNETYYGTLKLVPILSIERLLNKEDVYCLSALKNGSMIVNNMLTKNCDALRYAVATHRITSGGDMDGKTLGTPGFKKI